MLKQQPNILPVLEPPTTPPDELKTMAQKEMTTPPITDTVAKAKDAIQKVKRAKRTHRCRVCHERSCSYKERVWDDTGEEFDL